MSTAAPTQTSTHQANKPGGYEVHRPHGVCSVSGKTIEPGEKFMAALRETQAGFERIDVALDSWTNFDHAGNDIVGFWQTTMPRPEQKKKLFVDDAVLCELFERLSSATESNKIDFRFVLGLVLMRKRMVIYETSRQEADGREIWSVRMKGKQELIDLLNPRLDEARIGEVSQQLGEILNEEV